jgi:hypothetical protein
VREVRAPAWESALRRALDGVRIISSRATASDASLLYDPALPATNPGARATTVQQLLEQAVPRDAALDNLALLRLGAFTDEVRRKTFEELIDEIRRLKRGAFAPLSEQPFLRAVLFPSGGLGLIAVGQRLFELF